MSLVKSLREYIEDAKKAGKAIGHFNVSDLIALQAIEAVAREQRTPLIVGTSEGERNFFGVDEIASLVRVARQKRDIPIFLNADHTKSFEKIKEAVEAGYDAVLFDHGAQSLDENIDQTRKVVLWVKEYNKKNGTDVLVEGELGYIGTSSVLLDELPSGAAVSENDITAVVDAKRFVEETGVDLVAPAVGNIHGMLRGGHNPHMYIDRISELAQKLSAHIVLHGGSGIGDEQIKRAVEAGARIVHVNTELRLAWKNGFELAFLSHPNEIVPYKILPDVVDEIKKILEKKIKLFTS